MEEEIVEVETIEVSTPRSRFAAVSGIIVSTAVMALASGLLFAYIPVKLISQGFEPWVPAAMTPALAFGGLIGCFATGPLLRLSGHARVFMLYYALIVMSTAAIAFFSSPYAWLIARMFYGFAINGVFIVAQSWLHHASTDDIRGRVISVFYVSYIVALGVGGYLVGAVDSAGNSIPVLATFFVALAMLPVALTRLPQPEPPQTMTVDIRRVWRISPVGLAGMMTVGGLSMLLQSLSPIYITSLGYSRSDVGFTMLFMQLGVIAVQLPMGALSDRIDRRYVLAITAAGSLGISIIAFGGHGMIGIAMLILLFALWNGFNETLYSVSSALANDRADPADYVMLSSTQMIAWSVAAFVIPLCATVALAFLPVKSFMPIAAVLAGCFLIFTLFRMRSRKEIPADEREAFQPVTAQVVYPGDFANPDAPSEDEAPEAEAIEKEEQ
ncbi:MAG: MFS transporter [Nitratireductor sp.]|nr:MFS transporter [Nitratireductor sp.]MCC0020640.1 MFS transporter [Nitratireductor sp.]